MIAIPCTVVLQWLSKTKLLPWLWQVRSGSFQVFCKKSEISRNFKTNGIFSNWNHYFLYIFLILLIKLGKKTPFICSFHISTRPVLRGGGGDGRGCFPPGPTFRRGPDGGITIAAFISNVRAKERLFWAACAAFPRAPNFSPRLWFQPFLYSILRNKTNYIQNRHIFVTIFRL